MWHTLAPDRARKTIALVATAAILIWQTAGLQLAAVAIGGLIGWRLFSTLPSNVGDETPSPGEQTRRRCRPGDLCGAPGRSAAGRGAYSDRMSGGDRELLPRGRAHVRRRACRLPTAQRVGGGSRLGQLGAVPGRLRSGTGGARPALHLRGFPGRLASAAAERRVGRDAGASLHLPAVVSARCRRLPVLGPAAAFGGLPRSAGWDQRGRDRAAAGGPLRPGLDERHPSPMDVALVVVAFGALVVWRAAPLPVVLFLAVAASITQLIS